MIVSSPIQALQRLQLITTVCIRLRNCPSPSGRGDCALNCSIGIPRSPSCMIDSCPKCFSCRLVLFGVDQPSGMIGMGVVVQPTSPKLKSSAVRGSPIYRLLRLQARRARWRAPLSCTKPNWLLIQWMASLFRIWVGSCISMASIYCLLRNRIDEGGDNGHERRAMTDLVADLAIPGIPPS